MKTFSEKILKNNKKVDSITIHLFTLHIQIETVSVLPVVTS